MRVALLEATGHVVMTEVDMPVIKKPDEVLIRVKAVGICGSEVHAFEGTHPFRGAPVVMGHEMAGEVAAVGHKIDRVTVGDRVIIDPQWTCGECLWCQSGDINLCSSKWVLGTAQWPGGFGEYIVAPQETVFHLPKDLSFTQGAVIEPLSVAVHIARRANITSAKSIAILGTGSIGGMVVGISSSNGAYPIVAADIHQHCIDAAQERMGASHGFLLPDKDLVPKVLELTGGLGVDVVVISADDVSLVNLGLDMVKTRGIIVLVALLTEAPLQFMAYDMILKEAHLIGDYMGNEDDFRCAIELASSGRVKVEGIITHRLPIEQAQRGMELASTKDDNAIKVVLCHSGK